MAIGGVEVWGLASFWFCLCLTPVKLGTYIPSYVKAEYVASKKAVGLVFVSTYCITIFWLLRFNIILMTLTDVHHLQTTRSRFTKLIKMKKTQKLYHPQSSSQLNSKLLIKTQQGLIVLLLHLIYNM